MTDSNHEPAPGHRRRCGKPEAECEQIAARVRALSKGALGKRRAELRTWAVDHPKIPRKALVLLYHLLDIADFQNNGYAYVASESRAPVPHSTFHHALDRLTATGTIVVECRRWKGLQARNRYHFPTIASGQLPETDGAPEPESKPESKAESNPECKNGGDQSPTGLDSEIESSPKNPLQLTPPTPSPARGSVHDAFDLWNEFARRLGLPQAAKLTPDRQRRLKSRLADYGLDGWLKVLREVEASPFLRGKNDSGWRCSLDYLLQPKGFDKTHDGGHRPASKFGLISPALPASPAAKLSPSREVQVFRRGSPEYASALEQARTTDPARAAEIERNGWVKCRPLEPPAAGAGEGARRGPFDTTDIGWRPNPKNARELAWARDDKADLGLRAPRWGRRAKPLRLHYGDPRFQAEVTALYRNNSEAEARFAEKRGYVDIWPSPASIGDMAAAIVDGRARRDVPQSGVPPPASSKLLEFS